MEWALVHDCVVLVLSLVGFYWLGVVYLTGKSVLLYGLGKYHNTCNDKRNDNKLIKVSFVVFNMTLMVGGVMLEVSFIVTVS